MNYHDSFTLPGLLLSDTKETSVLCDQVQNIGCSGTGFHIDKATTTYLMFKYICAIHLCLTMKGSKAPPEEGLAKILLTTDAGRKTHLTGAQLKWPHRITGCSYPLGHMLYLLEILETRHCGAGNMCTREAKMCMV